MNSIIGKKAIAALAVVLTTLAAVPLCGWIFMHQPADALADVHSEIANGRCSVSVHRSSATARDAAAMAEEERRRDGWDVAPVSTATFKLFLRVGEMSAILAEDTPSGSTLTEFRTATGGIFSESVFK